MSDKDVFMSATAELQPLVVRMSPSERLFLWAIRAWASAHTDLTSVWWCLDQVFAKEGVHGALPPFHEFMSTLFAGLKRWPDIRCVACPHIGRDERRLLDVLRHLEEGNEARAQVLLNDLVLRSAARISGRHASECVRLVSSAGLRFSRSYGAPAPLESRACLDTADVEAARSVLH